MSPVQETQIHSIGVVLGDDLTEYRKRLARLDEDDAVGEKFDASR